MRHPAIGLREGRIRTGDAAADDARRESEGTMNGIFNQTRQTRRKRRWPAMMLCVVLGMTLCGCSLSTASEEPETRQVIAMTTIMNLRAYGEKSGRALDDGEKEIRRLDARLSVGDSDSEVSKLNAAGGGTVSPDVAVLMQKALAIYRSTGGAFDISIYPIMKLWGFTEVYDASDPKTSTRVKHIPSAAAISETLTKVGASKMRYNAKTRTLALPAGMQIDFGGIAKGYTSQRLIDIMKKDGVTAAMVELGGNVQVYGQKPDGSPWRVGIANPKNREKTVGTLNLTRSCAVITSGGYERYITDSAGRRYHHIIDPKTGYPAESGLASVTIICKDGTTADALSTALFVMGKDKAIAYWRAHHQLFDAILVDQNQRVYVTAGAAKAFQKNAGFSVRTIKVK
jgi:thiamine biosynthesis lipoprotein